MWLYLYKESIVIVRAKIMELPLVLLQLVKVATVFLGGLVVLLLFRGYRREGSRAMFFLAIGFGLITLGSVIEGLLFEFFSYSLLNVNIVGAILVLLGLISVVYSIYGDFK